jgi:hypothetical protein
MNKEKLIDELKNNCSCLLKGKSLINKDLWLGNPHPIHEYFVLFNHKSIVDDKTISEMLKIRISGVIIEKIRDTGWNCNTIKIKLEKTSASKIIAKKVKFSISNIYFDVINVLFFMPLIKIMLFFKRNISTYFGGFTNKKLHNSRKEIKYQEKRLKQINKNHKISVFFDTDCVGRINQHLLLRYERAGYREFINQGLCPEIVVPQDLIRVHNNYEEAGIKLDIDGNYSTTGCFTPIHIKYKSKSILFLLIYAGLVSYGVGSIIKYFISGC